MAGPGTPLLSEPTVWSSRVLYYLDKTYVYVNALTNRDYEGEAKQGGTVKAFWVDNVTVSAYTGGWTDADWATLTDNAATVQIDQENKLLVKIPDVREQFSVLNLIEQGSRRMAVAIGDTIDQFIATHQTTTTANLLGDDTTPLVVGFGTGETRPTTALARLRQLLIQSHAPADSARAVVPEWFGAMLQIELGLRPTPNLGDSVTLGEKAALKPGFVISVAGVDVYVSNNVPNTAGAKYKVLMGNPMITFASAIERIETLRLPNDFATGIRGLYVYGALLPRSEYMMLGTFNMGAFPVN